MINKLLNDHSTSAQLFRYAVVAGFGLVIDFGTVIFTKEILGFNYLLAAVCGFIIGLIITFLLSNTIVFNAPTGNKKKLFLLFTLIGVFGLAILSGLMWILTGLLGINYIISKALATVVVFIWNFFARKSLYPSESKSLPYEL